MMTMTATRIMKGAALFSLLLLNSIQAFMSPQVRASALQSHGGITRAPYFLNYPLQQTGMTTATNRDTTARSMYNLPPGGGGSGGGNNKNDFEGILGSLGAIAAVGLFFASPLGSIFFAITNSLFLLAILVPVLGVAAFQAWQYFYTLSGACPNCGAPVTVLKEATEAPSFCFNCGSQVQTSSDQKTIEFAKEATIIDDGFSTTGSIFDALFQQPSSSSMGSAGGNTTPNSGGGASSSSPLKEKESKYRRENTVIDAVIDVDVEDE